MNTSDVRSPNPHTTAQRRCAHAYSMTFDGLDASCSQCGAAWHRYPQEGWRPVRPAAHVTFPQHLAGRTFV